MNEDQVTSKKVEVKRTLTFLIRQGSHFISDLFFVKLRPGVATGVAELMLLIEEAEPR